MIHFACPHCKASIGVPESSADAEEFCPACEKPVHVPRFGEVPADNPRASEMHGNLLGSIMGEPAKNKVSPAPRGGLSERERKRLGRQQRSRQDGPVPDLPETQGIDPVPEEEANEQTDYLKHKAERGAEPATEAQLAFADSLGIDTSRWISKGEISKLISSRLEKRREPLVARAEKERAIWREKATAEQGANVLFACPKCHSRMSSDRPRIGRFDKCAGCGRRVKVPDPIDLAGQSLPSDAQLVFAWGLGLDADLTMTGEEVSRRLTIFDKVKHFLYGAWIKMAGESAGESGIPMLDMQALAANMVNGKDVLVAQIDRAVRPDDDSALFLRRDPQLLAAVGLLLAVNFGAFIPEGREMRFRL